MLHHLNAKALLVRIVSYALAIEGVGALILSAFFARDAGWGAGLWRGAFHAISAFCNAGFSLFSNNLEDFAGSWVVNLTVMALIVLGGIGFLVITDVEEWLRRRRRLSLHTKVVLVTTCVLIVAGTAGFYLFETDNVLAGRPAGERVLISLFQS